MSKQVNKKCPPRNTILPVSTPYTDPEPSNCSPQNFKNLRVWNSLGQPIPDNYRVTIPYKKNAYVTFRTL